MKAQIEKLIAEYEFEITQREKGDNFYTDAEYYRNEGRLGQLEEVVADLKKVLNTQE